MAAAAIAVNIDRLNTRLANFDASVDVGTGRNTAGTAAVPVDLAENYVVDIVVLKIVIVVDERN